MNRTGANDSAWAVSSDASLPVWMSRAAPMQGANAANPGNGMFARKNSTLPAMSARPTRPRAPASRRDLIAGNTPSASRPPSSSSQARECSR